MVKDASRSQAGRSGPETADSSPRLQMPLDQSPSQTASGYVLLNTAGSASDPRSMPRTLPSVSRTPNPRALDGSSFSVEQTSGDHWTLAYRPQYSIFPYDERLQRGNGQGHSLNHPPSPFESGHADDLMSDGSNAPSSACVPPSTPRRRPSRLDPEQDLLQPGQIGPALPRRPGLESRTRPDEAHRLASRSPVVDSTTAPINMSICSRPSLDAPASLDGGSCRTQELRSTVACTNEVAGIPVRVSDVEHDSLGYVTAIEPSARHSGGVPSGRVYRPTITNIGRCAVLPLQREDVEPSSKPSLETLQDLDRDPPQQSDKPALTVLDLQPRGSENSLTMPADHASPDRSTSSMVAARPGLHLRLISTSSTSTDGTESTNSDSLSSETENEPVNIVTSLLTRQLITCLLADWSWNSLVLDFKSLAANVRKCPQGSAAGQASESAGKRRRTESPRQRNASARHGQSDDEKDHESDGQPRRRRQKIQTADDSSPSSPRLLACPFHKKDPLRFSAQNEREKEYRTCSSGYWPNITRLKQHLNRAHRRPRFYCPSCYVTFEKQSACISHIRLRPPCDAASEPRFEEKMSDEQMSEINKKRPRMSMHKSWNLIFEVLFPSVPVPDSPYIATSEHEWVRNLEDYFRREIPRTLPLLLHGLLQHALPSTHMDPDLVDRVCEECIAFVIQLLPSGRRPTLPYLSTNALADQHLDGTDPSCQHGLVQPEAIAAASQNEVNDPLRPLQDRLPSHVYLPPYQPSGVMEPHSCHGNVGSTGLMSPDYCRVVFPEQTDAVEGGTPWDVAFAQLSEFVDQNMSP